MDHGTPLPPPPRRRRQATLGLYGLSMLFILVILLAMVWNYHFGAEVGQGSRRLWQQARPAH